MWQEINKQLVLSVKFADFTTAWAFMTEAAIAAEKLGHHPDWQNVYNRVVIRLSTHEAGNTLTSKDFTLAEAIDNILSKYNFETLQIS